MKPLLSLVTRQLRPILTNWKTSLTGAAMIAHGASVVISHLSAIADGKSDIDPVALQLAYGELAAGFGLLFARDGNKSSQDSGIR